MAIKKPSKANAKSPPKQAAKEPSRPSSKPPTPRGQPQIFEDAVKLLHAGDFVRAKALFEQVASGPVREIAHAARVHARMCEHRMAKADPVLKSPEDHYNFAITLMNQRSLEAAEQHLRQALQMASDGDHLHYALALCRGLRGDVDGASKHLKRAIELQPRNRLMARNDPDFVELSHHRALNQLLYPTAL